MDASVVLMFVPGLLLLGGGAAQLAAATRVLCRSGGQFRSRV
jgi:hypothetical protein